MSRRVGRDLLRSGWVFGRYLVPQTALPLPLSLRPSKPKSDNHVCASALPHADSRSYRIGFEYHLETKCQLNEISDEVERAQLLKGMTALGLGSLEVSCFQTRRGVFNSQRLGKMICFRQSR